MVNHHNNDDDVEDVETSSPDSSFSLPTAEIDHDYDEKIDGQEMKLNHREILKNERKDKKNSTFLRVLFAILRVVILDLPLATTCLFFIASLSAEHIYQTYYIPIIQSLAWNDDRRDDEITGYVRVCDHTDISTLNSDDFIIDPNSTSPAEAVHIINKHGMAIFPNLLRPSTAANMRQYILDKNAALTDDEAIWLISNENRWSFPIGADDHPAVPPALQEIATNPSFLSAIEELMGEDPAMVEFTAITAAYGAGDQHWHADNDFTASHMNYARSFVPMYSLFIPLQDTTKEMGATGSCPGTHLCGEHTGLGDVCERFNFQVADSRGRLVTDKDDDRLWKTGDGYLMNLNTYHRGPGHTDPNAPERVMLILTMSPRPKGTYFDRRQISLGTSYSCKWDMWGMTMKDLALINRLKGSPWKQLRTLGIYKSMGSHRNKDVLWGWDYLTVACSRISNKQFGFRLIDLEAFNVKVKRKGNLVTALFGYLPDLDDLVNEEEGWHAYIEETLRRCIKFGRLAFYAWWGVYVLASLFQPKRRKYIFRGVKISAFIGFLGAAYIYLISLSPWGMDIANGIAQNSPIYTLPDAPAGRVTLPVKKDVVITTRLDSFFLAGHNLIYNHQPGNELYNDLLSKYSISRSTPDFVVRDITHIIVKSIRKTRGRFVMQNEYGDWRVMANEETFALIEKDLIAASSPILKSVEQTLRFLKSECRFGRLRETALFQKHAPANLLKIEKSIFRVKLPITQSPKLFNLKTPGQLVADAKKIRSSVKVMTEDSIKEDPLVKGDDVEVFFSDRNGWFSGIFSTMTPQGAEIHFGDDSYIVKEHAEIRRFEHFVVGETVEYTSAQVKVNIKYICADGRISVTIDGGDEDEVFEAHISEIHRFK